MVSNNFSIILVVIFYKVIVWFQSFKQEENKQQLPQLKKDPAPKPLSRAMHNLLVDIFQKIGVKETTKEGLLLLYEFREQHPEVDTEPFLKRATQFFQEYVEKGLEVRVLFFFFHL